MPKASRQRRTPAEIHSLLSDLSESGQSRRDFAFTHHIPLSTLQSWIRKHGQPTRSLPEMIPVGVLAPASASIEIEFPGGEILRCGPGCCAADLRVVLSELRRC